MRLLNLWQASIFEHGIKFTRDMRGDGVFSVNIMIDKRRIHRVIGENQMASLVLRLRISFPTRSNRCTTWSFVLRRPKDAVRVQRGRCVVSSKGLNLKMEGPQGQMLPFQQHLVPSLQTYPLLNISSFEVERYKGAANRQTPLSQQSIASCCPSHLFNKAEMGWCRAVAVKVRRFQEIGGRIVD